MNGSIQTSVVSRLIASAAMPMDFRASRGKPRQTGRRNGNGVLVAVPTRTLDHGSFHPASALVHYIFGKSKIRKILEPVLFLRLPFGKLTRFYI